MPLASGDILNNRYQIKHVIGRGGFGAVYYAFDAVLHHPCAVKENLNDSPEAQRQFEREAVILAGLRHTNLPRVFDHFLVAKQGQYLVMDYIEGQSLYHLLKTRSTPLSEQESLTWIKQVCQALIYLHQQNPPIIHRDIKPHNIIISPLGEVVLVDFGLSKLYGDGQKTSIGAQGVTFGYAPPEQYGQGQTDARSDVYGLGATLYTMLTGQPPPDAIKRLMEKEKLTPPRDFNQDLSPHVEQAVLKAMKTTTSERFQSVAAFQRSLTDTPPLVPTKKQIALKQQVTVKQQADVKSSPPQNRPQSMPMLTLIGGGGVAALALVVLIVVVGGLSWFVFGPSIAAIFEPNLATTEETPVTNTPLAVVDFATNMPTSSPSPLPLSTVTSSPTVSPSPTATAAEIATPTPDNRVLITAARDMNIRSGPGTNYPIIGDASTGDTAIVMGRNADQSWLEIEYLSDLGASGWVFAELIEATGNIEGVIVAQIPAPPPPTATEIPTVTPTPSLTPPPPFQFGLSDWQTQSNAGIILLRGIFRDAAGNPVNGYSIFATNGSWSVLSHPSGASHHYPEIDDGEWDIVLSDPVTAAGDWTLTVVRYDCPNFNQGFDAQCKQFTRLSEDFSIHLEAPHEAILDVDWVCHWDCDKGLY